MRTGWNRIPEVDCRAWRETLLAEGDQSLPHRLGQLYASHTGRRPGHHRPRVAPAAGDAPSPR